MEATAVTHLGQLGVYLKEQLDPAHVKDLCKWFQLSPYATSNIGGDASNLVDLLKANGKISRHDLVPLITALRSVGGGLEPLAVTVEEIARRLGGVNPDENRESSTATPCTNNSNVDHSPLSTPIADSRPRYDVWIICARPEELAKVKSIFELEHVLNQPWFLDIKKTVYGYDFFQPVLVDGMDASASPESARVVTEAGKVLTILLAHSSAMGGGRLRDLLGSLSRHLCPPKLILMSGILGRLGDQYNYGDVLVAKTACELEAGGKVTREGPLYNIPTNTFHASTNVAAQISSVAANSALMRYFSKHCQDIIPNLFTALDQEYMDLLKKSKLVPDSVTYQVNMVQADPNAAIHRLQETNITRAKTGVEMEIGTLYRFVAEHSNDGWGSHKPKVLAFKGMSDAAGEDQTDQTKRKVRRPLAMATSALFAFLCIRDPVTFVGLDLGEELTADPAVVTEECRVAVCDLAKSSV